MLLLKRLSIVSILFLVAACSGLAGDVEIVATFQPPPTEQPVNVDHPDGLGAAIFEARCSSCHGLTGAGDGGVAVNANMDVPDFTDPATAADQTIQDWTNTIRYGRIENLMPPWKDSLSEDEIDAVAEYTYTLWENAPEQTVANTSSDPTAEAVAGSITGSVTMQTADATAPDNIAIGLHLLDEEQAQVSFHTQELDGTLDYTFDDIPIRSDYSYMVTAAIGNSVFSTDPVNGTPADPNLTIPIDIYESTDDPAVIELDLLTMILVQEQDQLVVQQFMSFVNTSDRIYQSAAETESFAYESVEITLPPNAFVLNRQILSDRFLIETEGNQSRLVDTKPVIPGKAHMIEIVYTLPPAESDRLSIDYPLHYTLTDQPEILVTKGVHTVESGDFELDGITNYDFGTFEKYTRAPLQAGETVAFDVQMPQQSAMPANVVDVLASVPDVVAWVLFGLGSLLVVGGGIGIFILQRRKPHPVD